MDQIRIGQFIKELRTEKGLKQRELADMLSISSKTISKWETGKGLPEVELMMPLCNVLNISVNELLSGERIAGESVATKADENIISILGSQKQMRKKLIMSLVVVSIVLISSIAMLIVASFVDIPTWSRISLIIVSLVVLFAGIFVGGDLDRESCVYKCNNCGRDFVPDFLAYINSMHTIFRRRLRCPHCGKKSWCKRAMQHDDKDMNEDN